MLGSEWKELKLVLYTCMHICKPGSMPCYMYYHIYSLFLLTGWARNGANGFKASTNFILFPGPAPF